MNKEVLKYDMLSIHPDRINIVHVTEIKGSSKRQIIKDDDEVIDSNVKEVHKVKFTNEDKLSNTTQRKLRRAIKYMDVICKNKKIDNVVTGKVINYKMSFVTLTLSSSQIHSDQCIKNLLINQFVIEAKKKWKIEFHIWRLEKQRNGNAHFHFIFDKFIPHAELREVWNRIQNKLGYVDRYQTKMELLTFREYQDLFKNNKSYDGKKVLAAYKKGKATNWKYPNSTDVHSLMFINNIDSYLIKYMSKDEQNKGIEGRLWGCSQNLSNITGARDIVDSDINNDLIKLAQSKNVRHIADNYYTVVFFSIEDLRKCKCYLLYNMLRDYLLTQFNHDIGILI
jgi:hypothetical protein